MSNTNVGGRSNLIKNEELGLTDIWRFLLRNRAVLIVSVAVGVAASGLLYLRAPHLYTATTTVEMNKDSTSGIGLQDLSGAASLISEGQGFMTDVLTQQAVLMSDSTALSVIDRLNLLTTSPYNSIKQLKDAKIADDKLGNLLETDSAVRDGVLKIFKSGLQVTPVKNTRLLSVSYVDKDPARAAQIANAVVEAYLTNHTRTRYDSTAKASKWLTEQLDELKHHTEDIHLQIGVLEKKSGIVVMPGMTSSSGKGGGGSEFSNSSPDFQRLSAMNLQLSQAETMRIENEAIYRMAQSNDPDMILGLSSGKMGESSGSIVSANSRSMVILQNLHNQESMLRTKLASEQVTYGARNPIILDLQNQLASVRTQIAEELGRLNTEAQTQYLLAKANEDAIRASVDQQQQKLLSIGNDLAELAFLREEEESSRKLYQDLYSRLEEASIAAGVRSSGMAIDDPARPPSLKSSPVLRKYLAAGLIGGLILGIMIGAVRMVADTTLSIPEDFESTSQVPLLGVVPGFELGKKTVYGRKEPAPAEVADQAWVIRSSKSQVAEAYRQIRTAILLSNIDNPPRVLLFTSPASGDGKSSTAYNLAAAFAAQSASIALIDADMRRPSLHRYVKSPSEYGLSDVLSSRRTIDETLQQHATLPSLKMMTSGTIPPDPSELLGSRRFAELIATLRDQFDYVFIDCPPVIPVTDPIVAGVVADAIVVVVRAGKTTRPELKRLWTSLEKPSLHVLGYIVNDFHSGLQSYGYGYQGYKMEGYYTQEGGEA